MKKLKRKLPKAEVDPLDGDLSELMLKADWQSAHFEVTKKKNRTITLRISEDLLMAIKKKSEKMGIDYQKYIRLIMETSLKKSS